ncbi:3-hydroxybutyryl-CoA dehydrogenase [Pseudonocardia kujensis]|uniref:3-hydroxybutyryl-CoA dehydrogenase n=1 Tax=Pseudonocardia kujensis TaxID=1128675 RepID=UPI001E479211|nr:3-hydroxybutyryl-CoA dehydrogenase [Pseudonocardia kujensis]MCE0762106.1 3-hydroxybutyryl-CoA dehydrogenase [Pseudonocardia kujensis]
MNAVPAEFGRIGVVGGGVMGSGIAEVCALAGCEVIIAEANDAAAARAKERVDSSLERAVRKSKLEPEAATAASERISAAGDLASLHDRSLVIEAVLEDEAAKVEVFRALDSIVTDPDAVLASNTSSIPIMKLGIATSRPEQVIGVHFFNPVPVLSLVELVPSLLTGDETTKRVEYFVEATLGKQSVRCQDRAGFIVNALLVPYLLSAVRMVESGYARAEDVDTGMVQGCAHPLGPLQLADLIGLDTVKAIAESMYLEFKEPLYSPPPLLNRMVEAGLLGRKSGRGFHQYAA